MKFQLPFTLVSRRSLQIDRELFKDTISRLNLELAKTGNDLSALRSSTHVAEIANAREKFQLNTSLAKAQNDAAQAQAIAADKQREIADLRRQVLEKEQQIQAERAEARNERQKLMDWIAKGVSNGIPIFAEIPLPATDKAEAPPAPPKPGSERVPTELEDAVSAVGRRARAIVRHVEKKRDISFAEEMAGQGVRRIFDSDRVDAEVEAELMSEHKKSA